MVEIKPGDSGVVTARWSFYPDPGNPYGPVSNTWGDFGGEVGPPYPPVDNGSVGYTGFKLSWSPVAALFTDTTYRDTSTPGHPTNTVAVLVSVPATATPGSYFSFVDSLDTDSNNRCDVYYTDYFTVPGPLTGNVTVNNISGLQACVDLSADATSPQKVVSAVIDWGDGNSTTVSPAPDSSDYFGHECHTYASAGTYTVTATYTDDTSPTPNSISPTTSVTVGCISTADMTLDLVSSFGPTNGIYVHCYNASVTPSGGSYSYTWTFPDNTTVTSGGGSSDATAQFCISTAYSSGETNFGIVSCTITDTSSSCSATVSRQVAANDSNFPDDPTPSLYDLLTAGNCEAPEGGTTSVAGNLSLGCSVCGTSCTAPDRLYDDNLYPSAPPVGAPPLHLGQ